jgi:hypothetical protein
MKTLKLTISLFMSALVFMFLGCVTQPTKALDFVQHPLLLGTNLTLYIGTADTATTFTIASPTYNTNRTYVTPGGTTVTPSATNSLTGTLYPVPAAKASSWSTLLGNSSSNLIACSLNWTIDAAYTNTATTISLAQW